MKRLWKKIIIAVCFLVLLAGAVNLYLINSEYDRGKKEYDSLQSYIKPGNSASRNSVSQEQLPTLEEAGIPEMSIDDESLKEMNSDYCGWLYMPELEISYPIVHGEDNEFYLHHTFSGEKNSSGCVFMEAACKGDFSDYNTFLYGHNMKNGTMFGSLKRYTREEDLYDKAPEFFIYLADTAMKYRIYSYYIVSPSSDSYSLAFDKEGYEKYLGMVIGRSVRNTGVSVDTEHPTVTLATCSGTGANKKRLIVHGILEVIAAR